jgi:hypothetical protein
MDILTYLEMDGMIKDIQVITRETLLTPEETLLLREGDTFKETDIPKMKK